MTIKAEISKYNKRAATKGNTSIYLYVQAGTGRCMQKKLHPQAAKDFVLGH